MTVEKALAWWAEEGGDRRLPVDRDSHTPAVLAPRPPQRRSEYGARSLQCHQGFSLIGYRHVVLPLSLPAQ